MLHNLIQLHMRSDIKKMKVMTVVGTRPEIIRLSRVIAKLDDCCEHILVHTGQNYDYELNEIFFEDLDIRKPDFFLGCAGANATETIGNVLIAVDKLLDSVCPDAMLVLGDTNSCMAVVAAKRRKIPTFHMEAGNRCFDMRVPEEINRRIVDHTADINLTYSSIARDYLLREGLSPDMVIKTGSPMNEVLAYYDSLIRSSAVMERLKLDENQFFLVSAHREENIEPDQNFAKLVILLNRLAETYDLPVVVSTHPRTQKRIDSQDIKFDQRVKLIKPLNFSDYNKLQLSAKAVLSDSGTINEESSILKFPALNLREAHERPEAMEEGSVMMVGMNFERVLQALNLLESQKKDESYPLHKVIDYSSSSVSEKIVRIIYSYVDYVNNNVWKKFP